MVASEDGWEAFWDAAAQNVWDDGSARRRRRAVAADGVGASAGAAAAAISPAEVSIYGLRVMGKRGL